MKITWLGHACFLLEEAGFRILIDPYTGVEGYPPLVAQAHKVLCSHQHFDHCARDCVQLLPEKESPFSIRTVETCHDGQGGVLRGPNTVHILAAGGITVAHLGDLGHQLTPEQLAAMGPVDGVLVPVGGVYTVDAPAAQAVCQALGAQWAVPMHYRHAPYGLPDVAGVEGFLSLWPENQIRLLSEPSFQPGPQTAGVIVPRFLA